MRTCVRWMAGLVVVAGLVLAAWGPLVFEGLTGTVLPKPVVGDPSGMASWAAMGLVRLFGAALVLIGAMAWELARRTYDVVAMHRVLGAAAVFGFAIAAVQALAVWLAPLGVLFALPFGVVLLATWRGAKWGELGRAGTV